MKTPSTFKLSKSAKRVLATYVDKHQRAAVKKIFIEGEYSAEVISRTRGKSKRDSAE